MAMEKKVTWGLTYFDQFSISLYYTRHVFVLLFEVSLVHKTENRKNYIFLTTSLRT